MSRDQVLETVTEIVEQYRSESDAALASSIIPITDMEQFDSLIAIECVALLEEHLRNDGTDIELPDALFLGDETGHHPSIEWIVDQVLHLVNAERINDD